MYECISVHIYITYFTVIRDRFYIIKGLLIEVVLSYEPIFHRSFHENVIETNQSYKPASLSHQSGKLGWVRATAFSGKFPPLIKK